jgi:hypothetical protein
MDSPFFEWGSAGLAFQQCAGAPALMTMRTLSLLNSRQQKRATRMDSPFFEWEPGNVLLSHGETPNYHRR